MARVVQAFVLFINSLSLHIRYRILVFHHFIKFFEFFDLFGSILKILAMLLLLVFQVSNTFVHQPLQNIECLLEGGLHLLILDQSRQHIAVIGGKGAQEERLLRIDLLRSQLPQSLECSSVQIIDLHDLQFLLLILLLLVQLEQLLQLQPDHLQVRVELVDREAPDAGSVYLVEDERLLYLARMHTGDQDIKAGLYVVVAELTHLTQVFLQCRLGAVYQRFEELGWLGRRAKGGEVQGGEGEESLEGGYQHCFKCLIEVYYNEKLLRSLTRINQGFKQGGYSIECIFDYSIQCYAAIVEI